MNKALEAAEDGSKWCWNVRWTCDEQEDRDKDEKY
jgi:hypothetical protein